MDDSFNQRDERSPTRSRPQNSQTNNYGYDRLRNQYGQSQYDLGGTTSATQHLNYQQRMLQAKAEKQRDKMVEKRRKLEGGEGLSDVTTDDEEMDPASKKAKKMKKYKSTFQHVIKIAFLASAISLIAVAALRFTVIEVQSTHEAILNFYFLFFGIVVALQQLGLKTIKRNFRFLNYYWGKAIFCAFIACASLSNSQNQMIQWVNAFLFFGLTGCMVLLAVIDRASDLEKSEQDEQDAIQWKEQLQFEENPALYYVKQKGKDAQAAYQSISQAASTVNSLNKAYNNGGNAGSNTYSRKRFQEQPMNDTYYEGGEWREETSFPGPVGGKDSKYANTHARRQYNF